MRTTVPVAAVLIGILALGCSERSPLTTAPPPPESQLRAESAAEQAVERHRTEMTATSTGFSQVAAAACEFDVAPEVFGTQTPVDNRLFFAAAKGAGDQVSGVFAYTQSVNGNTFRFAGRITCLHLYDFDGGTLNRAKLGGPVDYSTDPTRPPGTFIWWQTIDNGRSPGSEPDKSTLAGFGDQAANEAFCTSPAPPRFGPWHVDRGNIYIQSLEQIAASNH